jgi:hypothetical protein
MPQNTLARPGTVTGKSSNTRPAWARRLDRWWWRKVSNSPWLLALPGFALQAQSGDVLAPCVWRRIPGHGLFGRQATPTLPLPICDDRRQGGGAAPAEITSQAKVQNFVANPVGQAPNSTFSSVPVNAGCLLWLMRLHMHDRHRLSANIFSSIQGATFV